MTDNPTSRMRHERARRRELTVADRQFLAPNYISILFSCHDFGDFVSASWDDHIKVFLPEPPGSQANPAMRDYTPRAVDVERGELTIEFALHEDAGPATTWARDCKIGDSLQIGGPRGSVMISTEFDWYQLIGDETAIPAISRCMEENPEIAIEAIVMVAGTSEQISLPASSNHRVIWVHRPADQVSGTGALLQAVAVRDLPSGKGFVWIAGEAAMAKAARETVLAKGHPLRYLKAKGYWVAGAADRPATFD